MSETLIGVLIGGLIASFAPLVTLWAESRRWKLEKKLERLREKRSQLERLSAGILPQLSQAMADNSYPSQMTSEILVFMPGPVSDRFHKWMAENDKDAAKGKLAFMDICVAMKKAMSDVDAEIVQLIDA